MPKRILIVDDEPLIVKGLAFSLQHDGYQIDSALDGEEALHKIEGGSYDLVLLDVMLPKLSGMEVCQRVRDHSDIPIIMITAKGEDMDKILGLEYGADDYMTKPFNILEVKARIKNILRRAEAKAAPDTGAEIVVGDLRINRANRSVAIAGRDINLTAKEFELLSLLASHPGQVFSREKLLTEVWKNEKLGDLRTVDVHIRRLREKVEENPGQPHYIQTKWKVGYYLADK